MSEAQVTQREHELDTSWMDQMGEWGMHAAPGKKGLTLDDISNQVLYFSDRPDEVAAQMIASVPMRRYGSLDEVASVVAFLLSHDASYLTGVDIEIAGGAS